MTLVATFGKKSVLREGTVLLTGDTPLGEVVEMPLDTYKGNALETNTPKEDYTPAITATAVLMFQLSKQTSPEAKLMLDRIVDAMHDEMLEGDTSLTDAIIESVDALPDAVKNNFIDKVAPTLPAKQSGWLMDLRMGA